MKNISSFGTWSLCLASLGSAKRVSYTWQNFTPDVRAVLQVSVYSVVHVFAFVNVAALWLLVGGMRISVKL